MKPSRTLSRVLIAAAVGLLLLPVPGAAPATADEEDLVRFTIGDEDIEIEEFLRAVAHATKTHILWNPADRAIRGKKMIGRADITAPSGDILPLVRGLLRFYHIVMMPVGPPENLTYLVMDIRETQSRPKLKPEHVTLTAKNLRAYEDRSGHYVTTTVCLEHATDLPAVRVALSRLVSGQNIGSVTEVPGVNAIVITDFAPYVVACYRTLQALDKPGPGSSTTGGMTVAVKLEHAKAVELAEVLAQHFAKRTPARPPPGRNVPVAKVGAPRITADARTNQVLLTGTRAQVAKLKDVIDLLDVFVPGEAGRSMHHVRLQHARASDAAGALEALGRQAGMDWTVVADEQTNALLVAATDTELVRLRELIAEMDSPGP